MFGYIYLTTNKVNGKKYIGKKQSDVFVPDYHGSGRYIRNALSKYGEDNFETVLIEECENLEQLNAAEKRHIALRDAVKSDEFYNISPGGEGGNVIAGWSGDQLKEFKLKMSNITKGKVAVIRDGVMKRIDRSEVGEYIHNGWCYGVIPPTDEQKQKQRRSMIGTRYMTNGESNVAVKEYDSNTIQQYLSQGYVFGRTKTERELQALARRREQQETRKREKEEEIQRYLSTNPRCERCGEVITQYIGSGRFCSNRCAVTHPHTNETKEKLRQLNLQGVCGRKGAKQSEEEKQKHREAMKRYYENGTYIWMTDGVKTVRVLSEEEQFYASKGFRRGRKTATSCYEPWNKGLGMEDPRVRDNIEKRNKTMMLRYSTVNAYNIKRGDEIE